MNKQTNDLANLEQMHKAGLLDEARVGYLALLRKNPREARAIHALGIIAAQQDKFPEAIEYLQKAIQLQPNDPTISLHLANILKIQGLFSQAVQVLQEALKTHPDYTPALNNLGSVYFAQNKFDDAIHYYRLAIQKQPDYIDAYYNLGLALLKKQNYSDAITAFETLLKKSPEHFAARFHLGCALAFQNKFSDALAQFLNIEEHHPNHIETQTNLATCYLKLGKLNEAKIHYAKAHELAPEDTQILFNLGVINMQQGNTDQAIQQYQRALQVNPNDFATHNNLGIAFLAKQHLGFALQHFREALRIQPNNTAIAYTVNALSQHQHLLAAPPDYVQSLFDAYADHYEPHLLTALEYQVPTLLHDAVLKIVKNKNPQWDILDIGCGTGLCGVTFKSMAKTLAGIDLSAKMLEVAAQKQIYDELITGDLVPFLETKKTAFDLILAGDVFVYIGDLEKIFENIHSVLREKGLLVFNAEISEKDDFKMNQSGRFSHSKKYLDNLAEKNKFKILHYSVVVTRTQNNEPVHGHLYVLQALSS